MLAKLCMIPRGRRQSRFRQAVHFRCRLLHAVIRLRLPQQGRYWWTYHNRPLAVANNHLGSTLETLGMDWTPSPISAPWRPSWSFVDRYRKQNLIADVACWRLRYKLNGIRKTGWGFFLIFQPICPESRPWPRGGVFRWYTGIPWCLGSYRKLRGGRWYNNTEKPAQRAEPHLYHSTFDYRHHKRQLWRCCWRCLWGSQYGWAPKRRTRWSASAPLEAHLDQSFVIFTLHWDTRFQLPSPACIICLTSLLVAPPTFVRLLAVSALPQGGLDMMEERQPVFLLLALSSDW